MDLICPVCNSKRIVFYHATERGDITEVDYVRFKCKDCGVDDYAD